MMNFGNNYFMGISIPLVVEDRYFILKPGDPPLLSVCHLVSGKPIFEVCNNTVKENPYTVVTKTPPGIVTVSTKDGGFIYKVRPDSVTSIVFGKIQGHESEIRISDTEISVQGNVFTRNQFGPGMIGIELTGDGIGMGRGIPADLLQILEGDC